MVQTNLLRRWLPSTLLAVVVGLVIAGVVGLNLVATAGASQETIVTLVPSGSVQAGGHLTVRLVANNVHNLAGFQGAITFDSTNLVLEQAVIADGLKGSGRDLLPFSPSVRGNTVVLGAATCPVASCRDSRGARAPRMLQGVDGQVDLGTLTFLAKTPGQYQLGVDSVQLVDPQGGKLVSATQNAVVTVTAP